LDSAWDCCAKRGLLPLPRSPAFVERLAQRRVFFVQRRILGSELHILFAQRCVLGAKMHILFARQLHFPAKLAKLSTQRFDLPHPTNELIFTASASRGQAW
jgi:hypothetical protein